MLGFPVTTMMLPCAMASTICGSKGVNFFTLRTGNAKVVAYRALYFDNGPVEGSSIILALTPAVGPFHQMGENILVLRNLLHHL